jgi:hypothetical protein
MNVFPWALFGVSIAMIGFAMITFREEVRSGAVAKYSTNLSSTNYKLVVGVWLVVATVGVSLGLLVLQVALPGVVRQVQIEFVWAIYALVAAAASLNTLQFKWKRETEDPAIVAAHAAARAQDQSSPPAPPPNVTVETKNTKVEVEQPTPPQRTAPLPVTTLPVEARPESAVAPPPPKEPVKLERDA